MRKSTFLKAKEEHKQPEVNKQPTHTGITAIPSHKNIPEVSDTKEEQGESILDSELNISEARQHLLALHNKARAELNIGPLKLNESLNKHAQSWATNVAKNNLGTLHSGTPGMGENTAWRSPVTQDAVEQLFMQWYSERLHYKYGRYPNYNTGHGEIGHYTQIMDEKSDECGFGLAISGNRIHLVGNYTPPGNVRGQYPWTNQ